MNKRLVPLFLSGLESDIFICGKYMRLLKLCKPNVSYLEELTVSTKIICKLLAHYKTESQMKYYMNAGLVEESTESYCLYVICT